MPKKNKQYDYDFEQDLNHEIPKIRNLSEETVWNKPEWTGSVSKPTSSSVSNSISRNYVDEKLTKKQYSWEKPNWVVANDNTTTPTTTTASRNNTITNSADCHIIEKQSIIKPNQHPILKTSKLSQIDQEMELLQIQINAAKQKKKAQLEQVAQQPSTTTKADTMAASASSGKWNTNIKDKSSGSTPASDQTDLMTPDEQEKQRLKWQLTDIKLSVKEREVAAWKLREHERRMEEKRRRDEARAAAAASSSLANKSKSDTSWQSK